MTQVAADALVVAEVRGTDSEPRESAVLARLRGPVAVVRGIPHLGTWAGVALAALGLVLVAVAWGRTAGLTNVGLQVPYVVSAGFTGVGLVVVGMTLVSVSAKRADAAERRRQLRELRDVLAELRAAVEEKP